MTSSPIISRLRRVNIKEVMMLDTCTVRVSIKKFTLLMEFTQHCSSHDGKPSNNRQQRIYRRETKENRFKIKKRKPNNIPRKPLFVKDMFVLQMWSTNKGVVARMFWTICRSTGSSYLIVYIRLWCCNVWPFWRVDEMSQLAMNLNTKCILCPVSLKCQCQPI